MGFQKMRHFPLFQEKFILPEEILFVIYVKFQDRGKNMIQELLRFQVQ